MEANYGISVKVSRATLEKLKQFKEKHGYKSYDKAILAAIERSLIQDEILEKLKDILRSVFRSEFDRVEYILMKQIGYILESALEKTEKSLKEEMHKQSEVISRIHDFIPGETLIDTELKKEFLSISKNVPGFVHIIEPLYELHEFIHSLEDKAPRVWGYFLPLMKNLCHYAGELSNLYAELFDKLDDGIYSPKFTWFVTAMKWVLIDEFVKKNSKDAYTKIFTNTPVYDDKYYENYIKWLLNREEIRNMLKDDKNEKLRFMEFLTLAYHFIIEATKAKTLLYFSKLLKASGLEPIEKEHIEIKAKVESKRYITGEIEMTETFEKKKEKVRIKVSKRIKQEAEYIRKILTTL